MKMSFVPAKLNLTEEQGTFVITVAGAEVVRTKSKKAAASKFAELRSEFEKKFPSREQTQEQKNATMLRAVGDSLVGHNSLGGRKKRSTAGSTRTFGG